MKENYNSNFKVSNVREATMFLANIYKVYRINYNPDESIGSYGLDTITKVNGEKIVVDQKFISWFDTNINECHTILGNNIYDICKKYLDMVSSITPEATKVTNLLDAVYESYINLVESWEDELNEYYPSEAFKDESFDEIDVASWAKNTEAETVMTNAKDALDKFIDSLENLNDYVLEQDSENLNLNILVPTYPFGYELGELIIACREWQNQTYQ